MRYKEKARVLCPLQAFQPSLMFVWKDATLPQYKERGRLKERARLEDREREGDLKREGNWKTERGRFKERGRLKCIQCILP